MSLEEVFTGKQRRPPSAGPQEGRIVRVTDDGAYFTLPEYSAQLEFGPAPWNKSLTEATDHQHEPTPPPAGALCLVIFVGPGIHRPWVVGWS